MGYDQDREVSAGCAAVSKVREALAASPEYGSLPVEDNEVECYETPTGNFYRFDLISGGADIDVDVTEDGKVSLAKSVLL